MTILPSSPPSLSTALPSTFLPVLEEAFNLVIDGLVLVSDEAVYLKGAGSYAELDVFEDNTKFAVSMDIRPVTKDGMIVYGEDLRSSEFVSIGIKDGFVEVRYELH